jgi:hypothetical protein
MATSDGSDCGEFRHDGDWLTDEGVLERDVR